MRLSHQDLLEIIERIKLREHYSLQLATYYLAPPGAQNRHPDDVRYSLQIVKWRPDSITGISAYGYGGEYMLGRDATESDVVLKAMKAFIDFDEHEAREDFRYDGVAVLAPHPNINMLARSITISNGTD